MKTHRYAPKCHRAAQQRRQARRARQAQRQAQAGGKSVRDVLTDKGDVMGDEPRSFLEGVAGMFEGLARMLK